MSRFEQLIIDCARLLKSDVISRLTGQNSMQRRVMLAINWLFSPLNQLSIQLTEFWMFDQDLDAISEAFVKELISSHFHQFKNIRIFNGQFQFFQPQVIVEQQLNQINSLSKIYSIQYQERNQIIASMEQKRQQAQILLSLVNSIFQNQFHNQEFINLLRSDMQNTDDQFSANQQTRHFVAITNVAQYAGISDIEFFKSSIIVYIVYRAFNLKVNSDTKQRLISFIQRNFSWMVVYVAQTLQAVEVNHIQSQQIRINKQYFLTSLNPYLQKWELNEINQLQRKPFSDKQDNLIVISQFKYDIKTAFSRLVGVQRAFTEDLQLVNQLQKNQEQLELIQHMRNIGNEPNQYEEEEQFFANLDEIIQVSRGIQGPAAFVIAQIYQDRMNSYIQNMQNNIIYVEKIIIFMSFMIQIPKVQLDPLNIVQIRRQANFDNLILHQQEQIDQIQQEQIEQVQGWSDYFHIHLTRLCNNQQDVIFQTINDAAQYFKQALVESYQNMILFYGDDQNVDKQMQKIIFQEGIENVMIKKFLIRPVAFINSKHRQNLQEVIFDIQRNDNQLSDQMQQNIDINNVFSQYDLNNNIEEQSQIPRLPQRNRIPRRDDIYEYEQMKKFSKKSAIISFLDLKMEKQFNDLDIENQSQNCVDRVIFQIQKLTPMKDMPRIILQSKSICELMNILQQFQFTFEKRFFQSVSYYPILDSKKIDNILSFGNKNEIIIMVGCNHIFACSFQSIFNFVKNKSIPSDGGQKIIYPRQNFEKMLIKFNSFKKDKKLVSTRAKKLYNQRFARVYFDFETTFDDIYQSVTNKSIDKDEKTHNFDQTEFAYSCVIDIKIKFHEIIQDLNDFFDKHQQIECQDIVIYKEITRFKLECGIELVNDIIEIQKLIQQQIILFQKDIEHLKDDIDEMEEFQITDQIECFSYNGSKFDNHFILSAIKKIEGDNWYKFIEITGDFTEMKILKYKEIKFLDLRLMTAGQSLKQFCLDMDISQQQRKKEIDYQKMKTFSKCIEHKDEIMEYVLYDSIAIRSIHRKFEKSVRQIIIDYVDVYNKKQALKDIRGMVSQWSTISSLSMTIFRKFFIKKVIYGCYQEQQYRMMLQSYQGGYTQAFCIGQIPKDNEIFYLDFNSMYPSIMSKIKIPTDLQKCSITETSDIEITIDNIEEYGLRLDLDPLQVNAKGLFEMQQSFGHFSLFELSEFKFKQNCNIPSFGVKTLKHGTIYPLQYSLNNQDDLNFGQSVTVFGFQIVQAFRNEQLQSIKIKRFLQFDQDVSYQPIFKEFDDYMYRARLIYKQQKNSSMAQCVKVFINSLYGKFGQNHFDIDLIMSEQDFNIENNFKDIINKKMSEVKNLAYADVDQLLQQATIKNSSMFDFNNRDDHLVKVQIQDAKFINNHIGSFVFYASIIAAIGRTMIIDLMQKLNGDSKVFYADTDSIIINKQAFQQIHDEKLVKIDSVDLGAMKNEYPLKKDQMKTSIEKLIVLNKKVYQYMINNKWVNKFKGCKQPDDQMLQYFMNGDCVYQQEQTRFKKRNGNVTIIDFEMKFKLRLSRHIQDQGEFIFTAPFNSLSDLRRYYENPKSQVVFDQQSQSWKIQIDKSQDSKQNGFFEKS